MVYGEEFADLVTGETVRSQLHKIRLIIAILGDKFSFEALQAKLDSADPTRKEVVTDILDALQYKIEELTDLEKHSRKGIYTSARESLIRFAVHEGFTTSRKPRIPFSLVTVDFLNRYEKFMLKRGGTHRLNPTEKPVKMTTVAYYTNCFSEVLRKAVDQKVISEVDFPIGRKGYKIPKGRKPKKALGSEVIAKIMRYNHKRQNRMFGRDMWLFSYF